MQDTQLLPNQVLSEQQSLVVMKKLLAIAVSGITYLRGLFPEKAYGSKYVDGWDYSWKFICLHIIYNWEIFTHKKDPYLPFYSLPQNRK